MKTKYYLLLTFFIFFGKNVIAQTTADSIIQCKQFRFCYQNKNYTKGQLKEVLKVNPMAYKAYRDFRTYTYVSVISGGTFLVGTRVFVFDDENSFLNKSPAWVIITGAVILPITSIVTFFVSRTKFWKSIRLFNEGFPEGKLGKLPLELNLKYTGNGFGLVLNF